MSNGHDIERLGRALTLADVRPCGINLLHRPDSRFDQFAQWEEGPPPNLAKWQAAIRGNRRAVKEAAPRLLRPPLRTRASSGS